VSDTRWFEIEADIAASVGHFSRAVMIFGTRSASEADLDGYMKRMAFMHAMQSGHTSFERALLRIIDMLREDRPTGEQWHADLLRRMGATLPHRPALLPARLIPAAHETRKFRHRVTHAYDDFEWPRADEAIRAAELLSRELPKAIAVFRKAVDPEGG
jgi:hypothetical protein